MEQKELKKLQATMLEIMDEIHRICVKHDIKYFLFGGSMLGAVRHQGFIPWDDDMDIGMMQPDYDRFLEVAEKELKPEYYLHTSQKDPRFRVFTHFCKVRKNGTVFPEYKNEKYAHRGIFVDIFCFCYVPSNRNLALRFRKKAYVFFMLSRPCPPGIAWKRIPYYLTGIIPRRIYWRVFDKLLTRYKDTGYIDNIGRPITRKESFPYDSIYPVRPVQFEDREYFGMANPDIPLKIDYGDYMRLPPVEQREGQHLAGQIIFGDEIG